MFAAHGHHLHRQHRHRCVAAKNHGIAWLHIFRPVLLNHPQNVAAQEDTPVARHRVPPHRIQIVDPIGQDKAEAGGLMAFTMTCP